MARYDPDEHRPRDGAGLAEYAMVLALVFAVAIALIIGVEMFWTDWS